MSTDKEGLVFLLKKKWIDDILKIGLLVGDYSRLWYMHIIPQIRDIVQLAEKSLQQLW